MKLTVAISVFAAVCLVSAADAQKVTRPPAHPAQARPQRPENSPPKKENPGGGPASPQNLEKLLKLSPEQRNKALSSLPPERRAQILAKLDNYQKIPPEQRAKNLEQLKRLQTLPPKKQQQVRGSMREFQTLPPQRRQLMRKQLDAMKGLSDSDRRALMNSEEFRSKFTPAEQQMIEDMSLVSP